MLWQTTASHSSEPVRIGVTLGLTGKYEKLAAAQKRGFMMWQEDINRTGGILGREVKLRIYDDASSPRVARSLYNKMIETDKVDFVFAPFSSEITLAVLPVTEKHSYSLIASGASSDSIWKKGYKYVFGIFTPASMIPVSFLEMLAMHEIDRIAIIYADNSLAVNIASGAKKWAERFGLDVVFYEKISQSSSIEQLTLQAQHVDPEVLMVGGHLNEAVSIRQALTEIGWTPKAYYVPVGPGIPAFFKRLNEEAEFTFSTSQWDLLGGYEHPGTREFIKAYEDKYHERPPYFVATAYAAGQIMAAAIEKAGTTDRIRVRNTLSSMDTTSIIGRFGVDHNGLQIRNFTMVVQVLNGKRVVVWPKKIMKTDPVFK